MGNVVTETLCFFAAVIYPTHASLKAIQSGSKDESLQWLSYWMLHALLASAEELFESAIPWVPFYDELKFLFLLWAVAPQFKGATHLYEKYVQPVISQYELRSDVGRSAVPDVAPALDKASAFLRAVEKRAD